MHFFLSGAYDIQFLSHLPADLWLYIAIPMAGGCFALKTLRPVGALLLGFVSIWVAASQGVAQKLEPSLVGIDLIETFQIINFVENK